jgi:hypothetical protein
VARGPVDGAAVEVPAGTCTLVIETQPERVIPAVQIAAGQTVNMTP